MSGVEQEMNSPVSAAQRLILPVIGIPWPLDDISSNIAG
jgi:hypothetical protein